jgi:hypothetical protein
MLPNHRKELLRSFSTKVIEDDSNTEKVQKNNSGQFDKSSAKRAREYGINLEV